MKSARMFACFAKCIMIIGLQNALKEDIMDIGSISQLIKENNMWGNLMGTSQSALSRRNPGFMAASLDGSVNGPAGKGQGGFDDFLELVALAQAQAEKKAEAAPEDGAVRREMAKNIAEMKALNLRSAMVSDSSGLDDMVMAGDPAAKVWRANLESLITSDRFGNLLGHQRSGWAGVRKAKALEAEALESNLRGRGNSGRGIIISQEEADKLSYGLFSPLRGGESAALNGLGPDDDYWLEDPLKNGFKTQEERDRDLPKMPSGKTAEDESDLLKAQRAEAAKAGKGGLSRTDLDKLVEKVSLALDLDPHLVKAVIKTESNFDHQAVSSAGAKGLMQLMPGTARDMGVNDPFNPVENVWAGARYLKKMLERHRGNLSNALASYNWGPGNFDRKGKANMPGETRRYISTVTRHYAQFKKDNTPRA